MQTASYPTTPFLSTHAHADLGLLNRDTTALRLLRILQGWARSRPVETARGTVWVVRHHLEGMLGVVGRTVRRALRHLQELGWIRPAAVVDASGVERGGFVVAVTSAGGFWDTREGREGLECPGEIVASDGDLSPTCPPVVHELSASNIIEKKENNKTDGQRAREDGQAEDPPGPSRSPQCGPSNSGQPRRKKRTRDQELWAAAKRVAGHERNRRAEHPRADTRDRVRWPDYDDSCWAVYRLMERTGSTEAQLKAAIDLTWDRAVIHESTWLHWQGTSLWEGSTPGRLQAWLREPHNAKYLAASVPEQPGEFDNLRGANEVYIAITYNGSSYREFLAEFWSKLRVAQPPLSTWTVGQAWTEGDVVECMTAMLRERGVSVDEADVRKWAVDFLCTHAQDKASAGKA